MSKKEQAKLKLFADRLPDFHTYLLAQGDDFLNELGIKNIKAVEEGAEGKKKRSNKRKTTSVAERNRSMSKLSHQTNAS